jgi:hypothetical protein
MIANITKLEKKPCFDYNKFWQVQFHQFKTSNSHLINGFPPLMASSNQYRASIKNPIEH